MKKALKKTVARMVRDAWRLEALEPRVLLSADPVLGVLPVVMPDDQGHGQALHGAYDFDAPDGQAPATPLISPEAYQALVEQPRLTAVPTTFSVDSQVFDVGNLASQGYFDSTLAVAANETLYGSGSLNVALLNSGTVSPGHSPGVQNVLSYTQSAGGTLEIQLGGSDAGTGSGHYDQLNVSQLATLDGKLSVSLIDGFRPTEGQEFTFLTYGQLSGSFAHGTGFVQADDDLYFTIEQRAGDNGGGALVLVAHQLDGAAAFLVDALAQTTGGTTATDRIGEFLNHSYFADNQSVAFSGAVDLGQGLSLSGDFQLGHTAHLLLGEGADQGYYDVFTLSLAGGSGYLGLDATDSQAPGLAFSGADVGIVFIAATDGSDRGWVMAQGQASGASLQGVAMQLDATQLTLEFSLGLGTGNSGSLDLHNTPLHITDAQQQVLYTFDGTGSDSNAATLAGHASLTVASDLRLEGDMGFSVADGTLQAAGQDISARLQAGGMAVGIDHGAFGLVVDGDGLIALEASGRAFLQGGDFASVSADSATLRFNQQAQSLTGHSLAFGDFAYTFSDLPGHSAATVGIYGLQAVVGGSIAIHGDFFFQPGADGAMAIVASKASVALRSGAFDAGVTDADVGLLVLAGGGGTVLEATGGIDVALGADVTLAAAVASVRWNSTAADASGTVVDAAGGSHTFGQGLLAGVQEVAVSQGLLEVAGF
ncbi:LEPR-XLL domain-containing protein, partial [Pseudacidovorax intermedius]